MKHTQTSPKEDQSQKARAARPLWRNFDFLLLWSGQTVSTLGTNISGLALPLLVLALTHSPALAGLVTAVRQLPYLLVSLPAGALVDRWNRKKAMIYCDLVRWLALGSVPLAFVLGHLTLILSLPCSIYRGYGLRTVQPRSDLRATTDRGCGSPPASLRARYHN